MKIEKDCLYLHRKQIIKYTGQSRTIMDKDQNGVMTPKSLYKFIAQSGYFVSIHEDDTKNLERLPELFDEVYNQG